MLHENGSAILGSRPRARPAATSDGTELRFTLTGPDVNVITLGTPCIRELTLPGLSTRTDAPALLVSTDQLLELTTDGDGERVRLPERLLVSPAHVIRQSGGVREG